MGARIRATMRARSSIDTTRAEEQKGRQGGTGGGGKRERISNCVYEVATISRFPKNISLFCKRALQKRLYSAK